METAGKSTIDLPPLLMSAIVHGFADHLAKLELASNTRVEHHPFSILEKRLAFRSHACVRVRQRAKASLNVCLVHQALDLIHLCSVLVVKLLTLEVSHCSINDPTKAHVIGLAHTVTTDLEGLLIRALDPELVSDRSSAVVAHRTGLHRRSMTRLIDLLRHAGELEGRLTQTRHFKSVDRRTDREGLDRRVVADRLHGLTLTHDRDVLKE